MKAAGVTTIVFNGDPVAPRDFTKEATAQEYFPEWVVSASTLVDVSAFARTYDQEQWKHAFGVTQLAARTPTDQIGAFFIYKWFTGVDPPADGHASASSLRTRRCSSPSIQAVGPNLTPQTFRDAAVRLARHVGRAGDQPAVPVVRRQGLLARQGLPRRRRRHRDLVGSHRDRPRRDPQGRRRACTSSSTVASATCRVSGRPTDKMFDPTGAVSIYTSPPPGEAPGNYPSPAG